MQDETDGRAILIIGYGNTLRGDDGVGRLLAEELAERKLPRIRTRSVHQLAPELAEDLAACGAVIFIDASLGRTGDTVSMRPIVAEEGKGDISHLPEPLEGCFAQMKDVPLSLHVMRPQAVLAYARAMFGSSPKAWWLTVPGENFEVGESLSAAARTAAAAAFTMIERFIQMDFSSVAESQNSV